ncbi:formate dehydrogenase accessory sulfurtransferase FdhD [Ornithinimicrobium tianjinense]|uniref:Sulfur carrier protein FdhD n=1 Tax=Ornithinimicrobium tianjinense TaxID=1195761 RepID=A0A917BHS9_9MICO|nr:formate dehydrogenase accessory sulfurtransferase FdhD [Ornithinimicrobium tianjinense]GGF43390.1 sulfurtransferase FdhD [Ornithinimicrobium tianjinense]
MARVTQRRRVTRLTADGEVRERADVLAGEEPLEVRVNSEPLSVTMRTPGNDFDLAVGFLHGEGIVSGWDDVAQIDYRSGIGADGQRDYNVVDVTLAEGVRPPDPSLERHVYTSSSCGVCGTSSIEAVQRESRHDLRSDTTTFSLTRLLALPDLLREAQAVFDRTGGVHAAGLFVPGRNGLELTCLREDVGRHNAVDKVLGWALRERGVPLRGSVLQVSGRASFELVQKAALAGIPVLSAVSAPSSLAVELADDVGLTLIGFNRGSSLNVYAHRSRVSLDDGSPDAEPLLG